MYKLIIAIVLHNTIFKLGQKNLQITNNFAYDDMKNRKK
jgi:hypothetical protein